MKSFWLTALLFALSFSLYAQDRRDGTWWLEQSHSYKFTYLVGFFDGMNLGEKFSYGKYTDDKGCVDKVMGSFDFYPCLAETVGRFRFRKPAQRVIKRDFHGIVGAKSVGTSGYHTKFVVEALDGTVGYLSSGAKPIQQ